MALLGNENGGDPGQESPPKQAQANELAETVPFESNREQMKTMNLLLWFQDSRLGNIRKR